MKTYLASIVPFLFLATAVSAQTVPPVASSGWGLCTWNYTFGPVTTVPLGSGATSYLAYTKTKRTYSAPTAYDGLCCRKVCAPEVNGVVSANYSRVHKETITKTWSGKIGGTFGLFWALLSGLPFEKTQGGSEVTDSTLTTTSSGTVTCGNKLLVYDAKDEVEVLERFTVPQPPKNGNPQPDKTETRTQKTVMESKTCAVTVASPQSFDPCTGLVSGDACPPLTQEPCPNEEPVNN
jgi:hypothetical protein